MAIEQNVTPSNLKTESLSPIENEIPAYRAISPPAVVSVILGLLSILCFTHWFFLTCAAAAIVLGIFANRQIQRMPDVLTGRGLAQTGIGLGIVFAIASLTVSGVQDFIVLRSSKKFARAYVEALKKEPVEEAFWYHQPPDFRAGKAPAEVYKAVKDQIKQKQMFEMEFGDLLGLKRRLASTAGQDVHFGQIESIGFNGLIPYATVQIEVHGPKTAEFGEEEQFALAVLKGETKNRKNQWWVESLKFPYRPHTYVPAEKPVDDGHGHGGGGGGHAH